MSTPQPENTISLELAETLTTNWRNFISPQVISQAYIRAFYIPISDIVNLGEFHGVEAVRAYLSMEVPDDPSTTKIILVPVSMDNVDILSVPENAPVNPGNSAIYDFTKPCPEACDVASPLFDSK